MADRRPCIAGNWKMYKTGEEALELISELKDLIAGVDDVDVVVAPPFTALSVVADRIKGSNIQLAAQNLYWESEGAYTGEISPGMLISIGCSYVIVGHSERRQYFGEIDATVNRKIKAALAHNLGPIFCIGESLEEREAEKTFSVLDKQVSEGLESIAADDIGKIIIAYEPVWAIGTGKTASNEQAQEVHHFIRKRVSDLYGKEIANIVRILYGGSVKPNNIAGLMVQPDIDGALVGGASLTASSFAGIIKFKIS
ncbi:MAG: triose-phosphate isomerase [Deltaproteobacteria bacterium]|nr:triose-phosphate isomerase [Deltaproteobacteria bacterium]